MFHDESVGDKKLTLVVVKMFIKKDGVSMNQYVVWSCYRLMGIY